LLQDLVLVDIDAAINKDQSGQKNNRCQIKELIEKDRKKVLAVGGGIRNQ
jgi:phosphoribosylformimino-5-aminoimidazole carboxamide ribonucleotide (ProFAR) isomerase